jgi:hypothetical protein
MKDTELPGDLESPTKQHFSSKRKNRPPGWGESENKVLDRTFGA